MTGNRQFTADVNEFVRLTEHKMMNVARQSVQDVVRIAQTPVAQGGDMPVVTGSLRNSIVATIDGSSAIDGGVTLAIAQLPIGGSISFEWTAEYATARHYMVGVGQGGGLWRDKAAMQWEAVVKRNAEKVK